MPSLFCYFMSVEILSLLDELRAMAQTGLAYADDPYDEERYNRMLELVEEYYGKTLELPQDEVQERLAAELGYVTPKVGTGAAIFDADGRQLLMKRPESGTWCFPGGFVDVTESPSEAAVREAKEETGLDVEITELVGHYYCPPGGLYGPHGAVAVVYLCDVTGGELRLSHEGEALQFWPIEDVPEWFRDHGDIAIDARRTWKNLKR